MNKFDKPSEQFSFTAALIGTACGIVAVFAGCIPIFMHADSFPSFPRLSLGLVIVGAFVGGANLSVLFFAWTQQRRQKKYKL